MNKDAEGNEYTFRTPEDWGVVTGVLVPTKDGGVAFKKIDPESGDLKFTMHERLDRIERLKDGDDEDEELQDAVWNQQVGH